MTERPSLFGYDPTTGAYTGRIFADRNPRGEGWLVPAFCVDESPPEFSAGSIPVWSGGWSIMPDHRGEHWWGPNGTVIVDRPGDPASFEPPLSPDEPIEPEPEPAVPEFVSNSDWRVGLILWGRYAEVEATVNAVRDSGSIQGQIVWQRWEYANHVFRSELMSMSGLLGFSEAEVDESLVRARGVSGGNLSL